ncbi:hypothetical protein SAMN04515654_12329 [Halanaerobium congolense]|jgi:hypothetical protein|uniref:Uncharacterized protein n=1 Tax=Halanaerobium congolense TaxID=54121 RepID=A0A1M7NFJ0_9FIRM|nr:hypothetical protein [Halanaerobium congolense]SDJ02022.1 hypothetical protein SAMN04515654_12329 [Halanaerobium congolense]SET67158.1 hypothetical protein SAMN04515653_12417 [Halanaerobium congolense]SHN02460.1 hypothetical protein SAMN04515650_11726 [Halanaerobium congolense]
MRTFKERIKAIEEHFDNLTIEEFEKNMYNAGAYKIKAAEESGFRLSSSEEITLETDLDSYEIEAENYDASNTPDISSLIIPPLNINKLLDENKNE